MLESNLRKFNHLKIHSQFSICEGAIKIDDLKDKAKDLKSNAIGLCDTFNLCGAVEFSDKLSKVGTQPIIGTQINLRATTVNTLFSNTSMLQTTLTVIGLDSGARLTIPVNITQTTN